MLEFFGTPNTCDPPTSRCAPRTKAKAKAEQKQNKKRDHRNIFQCLTGRTSFLTDPVQGHSQMTIYNPFYTSKQTM